ncbi:hypothetical protein A3B21_03485 [Candidatus Uhrbacteria bacterium RIFCSPLOWO2_01_FULL_47_24]|uniref:Response regulatory domain-containing protein n=1 Tax=Candidatus Uhrbacteria bacterium RIFCSPLOWO2_01_FULL_47_24 TaxID=1802401 RepID=A0A1F7UT62_9BACT|nr:MAG: hypothetical protein A2753_05375 [Candidatus Uhrbacteria bacterium RIFCSPHIGHO2_01_FULL_47_11]OGL69076.1 MAG: hypothetical protein A3D58_04155 [Candidatus Uhrbacteria bacterium RIFCSPHIGHO2_02_FULL_46_47]OGL74607.1 MAG: hypothetical protein A3F52_01205 [Candidatus Uhrbacteria bacterium RIFCSPHIGHO2_12_FULL_47_11]OGL81446.1 MAG: hypothetical protein A3B21_03485 [Candidatus Uhrbacteria bacterium RIFCSPLOWO2_01_FULL_47_24]OGL83714.1 MAG: hypothetical protein A3J03_01655 [Candidatus Uhrbact
MAKKKNRILLIIEDDEILLRALYLFFENKGFTIASATDGDTGSKMADRLKPDIILLDLMLPKMSGFDVLKYVKANPALRNTPVIVLSNLGDTEDIDHAKTLGAADYFVKARTDLDMLGKRIEKILK